MIYLRIVWLHLRKDLQLEWRSREAVAGMLFFTLLIAVAFAMAFDPTGYPAMARQMSGGLLWVGLLFAATTSLNISWERERRNQVMDAHRMSAAPPSALFLGKAVANFLFVAFIEAVLAPVFIIFYNLHPLGELKWLWLILPLGTWAIVANGTFFAALGLRSRNRALMLPAILFPISIPALLGVTQATTAVITGDFEPGMWVRLIFGFDVIFTTACILLFETVLHAE
ncbi:heme exporter protein CcmB [Terriglobus sp. ADX1]|uniref:heme exporter protein CcmB n=1 Tax=Terriglobus sp. ADX1 TaxID=2794063 RepID=UPI002FE56C48